MKKTRIKTGAKIGVGTDVKKEVLVLCTLKLPLERVRIRNIVFSGYGTLSLNHLNRMDNNPILQVNNVTGVRHKRHWAGRSLVNRFYTEQVPTNLVIVWNIPNGVGQLHIQLFEDTLTFSDNGKCSVFTYNTVSDWVVGIPLRDMTIPSRFNGNGGKDIIFLPTVAGCIDVLKKAVKV